ncbi:hypothetical protein BFP97_12450 [Roseivirga sp. 4D4]|uniref:hypothetical protein n=1 Tax=Roseivirga sp. 4D4 TaxID=1889784 RepID=UPI000853EFD6|nr:hypothetical protein [Roseivirga sp. 4D4]OEK02278.1 hypothetical protein BFP97_12450 [Roseivirga sp. 4D4]
MTTINERILSLIKDLGDSESGFAKRIGVSSSVMFNIVNPKGRKSYPSGPVLEKILDLEKNGQKVSAEWLMRGAGDIYQSTNDQKIANPEEALDYLRQEFIRLQRGDK